MMRTKTLTKVGAAAGALVLLASTAAMAGPPTYLTVNGTGAPSAVADFGGTNSGIIELRNDYGVPILCAASALTGKAYRGSLIDAGMPIGRVTGLSGTCTAGTIGYSAAASKIGGSWSIDVKNAPASAGDPIDVEIKNMEVQFGIPGSLCAFKVQTRSGMSVDATLYPGPTGGHDARLEINSKSVQPLTVPGIGGTCAGEIQGGDRLSIKGTYNLDTTGGITGPISHS